jgi:hypothetical protein
MKLAILLLALLVVHAAQQCFCAPMKRTLIAQNINSTGQIYPVHPFSPLFIAQSGERFVEQIRRHAIDTHTENDPETKAKIQAAIFSGGAAAIHQGPHGDCWFEAGLAAVAHTPKGQQLLSNIIMQDSPNSYVVTFPWRGWWRRVTNQDLRNMKTRDNDLWARIVETAAAKSWPNFIEGHRTAGTPFRGEDADVMALTILTGVHARTFQLSRCSRETIRQMLEVGCSQQQPMEASTLVNPNPWIVVHNHAYTVMAYDPATRIVTLRNPWARSGQPSDRVKNPELLFFGESKAGVHDLGGGLIQMPVYAFKRFFRILVWAQI